MATPDVIPLPADDETAIYANDFAAWRSDHDVTLDLRVVGPVDGEEGARVATPIVRVRLPPTIIVAMAAALMDELRALEDDR